MKRLLLYIVFVSYAIVMIKPALPYVSDFIGHVLFYQQHLATVHFENGKYHLHQEVAKNIKEESSGKNTLPEKKKNTAEDFTATLSKATLSYSSIEDVAYGAYMQQHIYAPYLPCNYLPPRM